MRRACDRGDAHARRGAARGVGLLPQDDGTDHGGLPEAAREIVEKQKQMADLQLPTQARQEGRGGRGRRHAGSMAARARASPTTRSGSATRSAPSCSTGCKERGRGDQGPARAVRPRRSSTWHGVVWRGNKRRALVIDPSGQVYVVEEGDTIGTNDGRVLEIDDNLMRVRETTSTSTASRPPKRSTCVFGRARKGEFRCSRNLVNGIPRGRHLGRRPGAGRAGSRVPRRRLAADPGAELAGCASRRGADATRVVLLGVAGTQSDCRRRSRTRRASSWTPDGRRDSAEGATPVWDGTLEEVTRGGAERRRRARARRS